MNHECAEDTNIPSPLLIWPHMTKIVLNTASVPELSFCQCVPLAINKKKGVHVAKKKEGRHSGCVYTRYYVIVVMIYGDVASANMNRDATPATAQLGTCVDMSSAFKRVN